MCYYLGGFQNWTVTGKDGSTTKIPPFGQDIFYNQVMKTQDLW